MSTCITKLIDCLFEGHFSGQALDDAAQSFVKNFDSPTAAMENISMTMRGAGEMFSLYIFSSLFVTGTVIIWVNVATDLFTWKQGLFATVVLFIILLFIYLIFGVTFDNYLTSRFKVIVDSLEEWTEAQRKKIYPSLENSACEYVRIVGCK